MRDVFRRLFVDFFSTIVFLVVYAATGSIIIATCVGIAGAVGQFIRARWLGESLDLMTVASVALVVMLGTATILTNDPRFVLIKPSIAHFAIGSIMLRRNWMLRYMPPVARQHGADLILAAGYAWAGLMFALGLGTIAVAMTGDLKLWGIYATFAALAKVAAFGIQYVVFRTVIRRRVVTTLAAASVAPVVAQ